MHFALTFFFALLMAKLELLHFLLFKYFKSKECEAGVDREKLYIKAIRGCFLTFCCMHSAISGPLAYRNSIQGCRGEEYKLATVCWQAASEALWFHFN